MSTYTHARMPAPSDQQQPVHRRHPFTNANVLNQPRLTSPVKPQEKPKATPADPPLPRQNSKTTPPSPPRVIVDQNRQVQYYRVGFLGEVGFASIAALYTLIIHVSNREDLHVSMRWQTVVTVPHNTLLARSLPNRL